jgi:hypothetical protein
MTLERDRKERERNMERAIEIHRELSRGSLEEYAWNDYIPPISPGQRRGSSGRDKDGD